MLHAIIYLICFLSGIFNFIQFSSESFSKENQSNKYTPNKTHESVYYNIWLCSNERWSQASFNERTTARWHFNITEPKMGGQMRQNKRCNKGIFQ